jgi:transketolase
MLETYTLTLDSGLDLQFISRESLRNLDPLKSSADFQKLGIACRINSISAIKAAGSGHIGTSFSVIDLLLATRLFLFGDSFSASQRGTVLFSSKGHDAPGIYSVMNYFGEIPDEKLHELRRLNGLPGHPEVGVYGIPASTGSLGMGISKAKGIYYGKRSNSDENFVVVVVGDGELQEGQIWESLPGASRDVLNKLIVIVDANKIQSDTWVTKTLPFGDLRSRVEGCGWKYHDIEGHSFAELKEVFETIKHSPGPHFLNANTIKAQGVSFMQNFPHDGKFYKYHSGSPSDQEYVLAINELKSKLNQKFDVRSAYVPDHYNPKPRNRLFIQVWAELLETWGLDESQIFALDADLSYDTGTYAFREKYPKRYLQCGIAEQDMVSIAGGLALAGKIPVVHSFSSFLTTRPIEQIFNNISENTVIHYVGFLAGILPSAPGHSHQAVSDVGIMASMPGISIIEPSCEIELIDLFKNFITKSKECLYLRLGSTELPKPYLEKMENLYIRKKGHAKAIVTSGPTMTNIALEIARISNLSVAVITKPNLTNKFSKLELTYLSQFSELLVLENYLPTLGLFSSLKEMSKNLPNTEIHREGPTTIPKNGRTDEVLDFHGLSSEILCNKYGW